MKAASAATLAILATGQYLKFEFYAITLASGTVLRFTNADIPLTVGGNTYLTGLTLNRSAVRQKVGLEVQQMDVEAAPQGDNPAGAITVAGYPFLQAVNAGVFDGARVLFSKGFFDPPTVGAVLDTTPGLVPWTQGKVANAVASRSTAVLTIADDTQGLNVQMPRNLIQTGCSHTVFSAGCGLVKATFTTAGAATATTLLVDRFTTGLTQPDGFFRQGTVTFVTGPNAGLSRTVKEYVNAGGLVTLIAPLPVPPTATDTFNIVPGCPKTRAACSNSNAAVAPPFNNLIRFRGMPYVPVPETLYGGGTPVAQIPSPGRQGGSSVGSGFSGAVGSESYES